MSKSTLIRLYAKNSTEVTPGAFECNLDSAQLSNVVAVALKTVAFRNYAFNIYAEGEQKNNTFTVNVIGVGPITASIPESGFYTTQQVIDIIAPLIETGIKITYPADTFTMALNPNTNKVVATFGVSATLEFPADGGLNELLGNTEVSPNLINTTYEFNTFASLGGLETVTVNVASKSPMTILNVTNIKQRITNSLGVVPVDVPFGGLQTFTQPDLDAAMLVFSYPEDMTNIRFGVRDVNGHRLLDQKNHLVIELMVWFRLD